jgi:hypothetical protein
VVTAQDYEDFVRAIRIKLLREIGGTPVGDAGQGEPEPSGAALQVADRPPAILSR